MKNFTLHIFSLLKALTLTIFPDLWVLEFHFRVLTLLHNLQNKLKNTCHALLTLLYIVLLVCPQEKFTYPSSCGERKF